MRPLPLAALLVGLSPLASAQPKSEASIKVESVPGIGPTSLIAPTALTYAAPSLTAASVVPTPLFTPLLRTPDAATPSALVPSVLTPSVIVPQATKVVRPMVPTALKSAGAAAYAAPLPEGAKSNAALVELWDLSKKLEGEAKEPQEEKFSLAYLRFDKPLPFGKAEREAYKERLSNGFSSERRAEELMTATAAMLDSAGIAYERRERVTDGVKEPSFRITPLETGGSALNRLAWDLRKRHGADVEYSPTRLGYSAVATFNHALNTLFLPHFGRDSTFEAVLHEAHHSNYAARQSRGDLSPFHMAALGRDGGPIVPRAYHYASYASMEELTGHAKTIKQMLAAARREPPTSWWVNYAIDTELDKLKDISRSAYYLSVRMETELKEGASVERVAEDRWELAQLGPVGGGHWHRMRLAWSDVFLPVLDEPEPPAKKGLAKIFSRKPKTPGQKAAARTAAVLKQWHLDAAELIRSLRSGLAADETDWDALNDLADRLVALGWKAEKDFKASASADKKR